MGDLLFLRQMASTNVVFVSSERSSVKNPVFIAFTFIAFVEITSNNTNDRSR